MFKLDKRRAVREHLRKVNAGEVIDYAAQHGTDDKGNVLGDNGKPVADTAPKGFDASRDKAKAKTEGTAEGTAEDDDGNTPFDYKTLATHADLDGEKGLNGREAPEGWATMKVVEKQDWLDANRAPATGW
jgi:hypothetical protein